LPSRSTPRGRFYLKALRLLNQTGYAKRVRNLAVSVYDLVPHHSEQLDMFGSRSHAVAEAMDKINDKYSEFVITPALMMGMDEVILDRIAFGGVKELEELYQQYVSYEVCFGLYSAASFSTTSMASIMPSLYCTFSGLSISSLSLLCNA
jgi:hypothetical protein